MNGLKVLVADDDPNVREIIRLYFEKQQIYMIEALDGQDALEKVEKDAPDIIILDVMMPKMDGYEACREMIKKHDIPIIMLTAKGEEFDRVLGLELGADDYVTKPFSPRELIARIKAIFRRTQPRKTAAGDDVRPVLQFDGLSIHLDRREVIVAGGDTGIGISPGDQERVWERFFKVDRGRSRKNAGSGLGLAIVRELVELHEGDIAVQSELGKGTTFTVRIPVVDGSSNL
jgi:DNA-binding response OmpR family regulator